MKRCTVFLVVLLAIFSLEVQAQSFELASAVSDRLAINHSIAPDVQEQELIYSALRVGNLIVGKLWMNEQTVERFAIRQDGYITHEGMLTNEQLENFLKRASGELPNGLASINITSINSIDGGVGQPQNSGKPWLESNGFFANDSWFTSDKLAHMLGTYVLSVKLMGVYILSGGNKYIAALEAAILGAVWEYKDYRWSWETYGYIGGDGFSYRDLVADIIGCVFSLHLFDPAVDRVKSVVNVYQEAVVNRVVRFILPIDSTKVDLSLPSTDSVVPRKKGIFWVEKDVFWGRVIQTVMWDGTIVVVSATVNLITRGKAFPEGTKWITDDSPENYGVSYNQEISWILGPFGQSQMEDCASDEIALIWGEALIVGNEAQNAVFASTDVPFLGGKEKGGGWNNIHVSEASSVNVAWYVLKKINRSVLHQDLFQYGSSRIGVTPAGLGIASTNQHGQFYLAPYQGGATVGFTGDFTGMIQTLFR